ncbi:MAG: caspase family protein [Candidatus Methanoperedens sp.]|nr:caspase family protein [Candidatus Methanoperedens sp.]MCZ7361498.1 caspase family protein [Candidatus Methanoperedens sp.]HLB70440.1 caspase family protein [Candidatus Methanoperedens sp.]
MVSNKKALCVGINNFKNLPDAALKGCVNDANDMSALLKDLLGFADSDIVKLTDAQATKANIMNNLKSMVADAKAGKLSYLVFSLSSHGTQVPDTSGDEPDRADEAFCPNDLIQKGNQWDTDHIIIDDELHDLFVQLPEAVLLEVYMDTCHSGTGLKAIDLLLDRKPRYLPPPSLDAFEQVEGRRARGLHQALLEKGMTHHILWAGCRADQTSADANIGGTYHGAFTYYYCKHMRATGNKLSRSEVLKKVRADLKKGRYTQIPQLESEATVRKSPVKV